MGGALKEDSAHNDWVHITVVVARSGVLGRETGGLEAVGSLQLRLENCPPSLSRERRLASSCDPPPTPLEALPP